MITNYIPAVILAQEKFSKILSDDKAENEIKSNYIYNENQEKHIEKLLETSKLVKDKLQREINKLRENIQKTKFEQSKIKAKINQENFRLKSIEIEKE